MAIVLQLTKKYSDISFGKQIINTINSNSPIATAIVALLATIIDEKQHFFNSIIIDFINQFRMIEIISYREYNKLNVQKPPHMNDSVIEFKIQKHAALYNSTLVKLFNTINIIQIQYIIDDCIYVIFHGENEAILNIINNVLQKNGPSENDLCNVKIIQ
jgi:hypothetical protein